MTGLRFDLGSIFVGGLLSVAGCGGDDKSLEERVCSRLDECDVLGTSIATCVEDARQALRDLSAAERTEAEEEANECLRERECDDFFDCLAGGSCDAGCDFCWDAPGTCAEGFNGDDLGCDCGKDCDFVDVDCS